MCIMNGIRCITLSKMILNIWYDLRLDTRRVRIMNGIKYMTFSELKFNIWYDGSQFWGLWMDYNIIHSVNRYLAYDTSNGLIRRKLVLKIFNWIKYITFCELTLSIYDTMEGLIMWKADIKIMNGIKYITFSVLSLIIWYHGSHDTRKTSCSGYSERNKIYHIQWIDDQYYDTI